MQGRNGEIVFNTLSGDAGRSLELDNRNGELLITINDRRQDYYRITTPEDAEAIARELTSWADHTRNTRLELADRRAHSAES